MWRDDDECLTLVCRCVVVVSVDVSAELSPAMILSHDDEQGHKHELLHHLK